MTSPLVLSSNAALMDVQNIATHELGHGFGLSDLYQSKWSEQTMYGYSYEGDTAKRDLASGDISDQFEIDIDGTTITVTPKAGTKFESTGLIYVTVHLDYAYKGIGGFIPNSLGDAKSGSGDTATLVLNNSAYIFSYKVGDDVADSITIHNENVFKKNPGVAGMITDSTLEGVKNVRVELRNSKGLVTYAITDEDGWYIIAYKHTGKAAIFTVKIATTPYSGQADITLKANGFVQQDFQVD